MEILFKCDYKYYYIDDSNMLTSNFIHGENLDEVKHLKDVDALFHVKSYSDGRYYSIYFRLNNRAIYGLYGKFGYNVWELSDSEIQSIDYTRVNIKKLLDGNII